MSDKTENLAWKLVSGLMVTLQVITLAFCGYIVNGVDTERTLRQELDHRLTVQHGQLDGRLTVVEQQERYFHKIQ